MAAVEVTPPPQPPPPPPPPPPPSAVAATSAAAVGAAPPASADAKTVSDVKVSVVKKKKKTRRRSQLSSRSSSSSSSSSSSDSDSDEERRLTATTKRKKSKSNKRKKAANKEVEDEGDDADDSDPERRDRTPGCSYFLCCCCCPCCCHKGGTKRYPRSGLCVKRCFCLNRESKCLGRSWRLSRRSRCLTGFVACALILILIISCAAALWALDHRQTETRGVLLLVCMAPITAADAQFMTIVGAPNGTKFVQLSTWDIHVDDRSVIDIALDDVVHAKFSIQIPADSAGHVLASIASPDQQIWRMPSNSSFVNDPVFVETNPLCARGVTLVVLSEDREADALQIFDALPEWRKAAATPQTVLVQ